MICGVCGTSVPDLALACPVCTQRKSNAACHALQVEPLRQVVAGTVALHLRTQDKVPHIQMFGLGEPFTFCGRRVHPLNKHRYVSFSEWSAAKICAECRAAVEIILIGVKS